MSARVKVSTDKTVDTATLAVTDAPDAPTLNTPIADQTTAEDSAFSFAVPSATWREVDAADSLSFTATAADGTALPSWLTFSAQTATFSGTPDNSRVGSIDIQVTATDTTGRSVSDSFRLSVTNVNDAPVLTPRAPTLVSITEDDINNAGQTVASILGNSLTDVDVGAQQGIALTGATGQNWQWQFSLNAGATWAAVGAVSASSALLLRDTDLLRWRPDGTNSPTVTVSYQGWDQTTGAAGARVNISGTGSTTAFSTSADLAMLQVASVNDAPSFGMADGKVTTAIGSGSSIGSSIALQPDGKILTAGSCFNSGNNWAFALVRYNADGTLDTAFDQDGKVITDIGPGTDSGHDVVLQSDGKILVAGYSSTSYSGSHFALVRYNPDGSLDASFHGDGKVTTTIGLNSAAGDVPNSVERMR
jgi:uncharacterized delta-60 repeat protein